MIENYLKKFRNHNNNIIINIEIMIITMSIIITTVIINYHDYDKHYCIA